MRTAVDDVEEVERLLTLPRLRFFLRDQLTDIIRHLSKHTSGLQLRTLMKCENKTGRQAYELAGWDALGGADPPTPIVRGAEDLERVGDLAGGVGTLDCEGERAGARGQLRLGPAGKQRDESQKSQVVVRVTNRRLVW